MVIIEKKILELKCETFGEICNYDVFYYDVIVTIESKTSTWESENLRRCLIYLVVLEEGDKEGVR